jgi:large subunit ribosomal protein L21
MASKKMAVVLINKMQYFVTEGEIAQIDRYDAETGTEVKFPEVLLVIDGDKIQVGKPNVDKVVVEAEILEHLQGEKVRTFTYKAKARYRKVHGSRPQFTNIKINKIS